MENKLSNQEKATVLAIYLGCKTDSVYPYEKITGLMIDFISRGALTIKLSLASLEDITDEHALGVAKIALHKSAWDSNVGKQWLKFTLKRAVMPDGYAYGPLPYDVFHYLTKHEYAVPLFFGSDHWANRKTAIELELAIKP